MTKAVKTLPEEFLDRLQNVTVVVEDHPSHSQLAKTGVKRSHTLLGLYEGVPLTERSGNYGLVLPDKITIFQNPIESQCQDDAEITAEIQNVVQHEIAHHFGIDETTLRQIEKAQFKRKRKAP